MAVGIHSVYNLRATLMEGNTEHPDRTLQSRKKFSGIRNACCQQQPQRSCPVRAWRKARLRKSMSEVGVPFGSAVFLTLLNRARQTLAFWTGRSVASHESEVGRANAVLLSW